MEIGGALPKPGQASPKPSRVVPRPEAAMPKACTICASFRPSSFAAEAAALLSPDQSADVLKAIASDLDGLDRGLDLEAVFKQIAATTACHAAVKANYPLTPAKMAHILDELRQTAYSTICPHGRPVMLRLEPGARNRIEGMLDRLTEDGWRDRIELLECEDPASAIQAAGTWTNMMRTVSPC